jgi:lipopolysaccharide export system protein LptA
MFGITPVFAQQKVLIQCNGIYSTIPSRPGWSKFERQVIIQHLGTRIYCDYAEHNQSTGQFEARSNLRIKTKEGGIITGATLRNNPKQNMMIVDKDVVFTDKDSTQLFTDRMVYDQKNDISTYTTGGRIISDSTVLTSKIGHYHGKTKAFHCKTDVVIVNPDYTIYTDTLQMVDGITYFFSPTHVYSDSNYLYCENGWYKTKEKVANLKDNAFIQTKEQKMYGDSIYYEMDREFGMAFGNVTVIDSVNDIIIHSDFALNNKKQGDAWFTDNAVGLVVSDSDTLFLRGDTLRIVYDSNENAKYMLAYYHVRFFREDMQGLCDSMAYVMVDSTMTLFKDPIVWANSDQLSGDTISVLLSQNKPKSMHMGERAFVVSKGYHEGHFNQIKGRLLDGFFNDSSELERINVDENVETVYFVTDDADSSLIGILKVNAVQMEIVMEQRAISTINYFQPDDGSMFPETDLPEKDRFLKGFVWDIDRRPKSKYDILPKSSNAANHTEVNHLLESAQTN